MDRRRNGARVVVTQFRYRSTNAAVADQQVSERVGAQGNHLLHASSEPR